MNTNERTTYHYKIWIEGLLDSNWADWFDGFQISQLDGQTCLSGNVPDQVALFGVLKKLHYLGLVLVLVMRLEPPQIERESDEK